MAKEKNRRAMFKKGLEQAAKRSYETRDSFGESEDYLKKGLKIQKWNAKVGEHLVNIIPYIAGPDCPNQEEGYATHVLDIWVHQRVGPSGTSHLCLAKNFKKPCPLCDLQREMRKDGGFSEDDIKALQPKRRTLYNVVCLDTLEEERKGVQIWEVSFHFMEKHLAQLAKNPKGGGFIPFQDPDTGKSISWTIESKGGSNREYVGHRFVDRDAEVSDEQLDDAQQLDQIVHIPSYEELLKVVSAVRGNLGGEHCEDEEEQQQLERAPKNERRPRKPEPEPDPDEEDLGGDDNGDDEGPWEEEPEPPRKPAPKKPVRRPEPEPEDEPEPEEDPDYEPEPPRKPAPKKPIRRPEPEPEPEDEPEYDNEPEDEEPPKKPIAKKPVGRLRR
jgi:hypothetical protein